MDAERIYTLKPGQMGLRVHRATEPPVATVHGDLFQLSFHAVNRMRHLKAERYRFIWRGENAQAWWAQQGSGESFGPGKSAWVVAEEFQSHVCGRGSVIEAHVISCEIAPDRWPDKRDQLSTQEQSA